MDDIRIERRKETKGYVKLNTGKYAARINIDGKRIHLGTSDCPDEARQMYLDALVDYREEILGEGKKSAERLTSMERMRVDMQKARVSRVLMQKRIDTLDKEINLLNKKLKFLYRQFNSEQDKS